MLIINRPDKTNHSDECHHVADNPESDALQILGEAMLIDAAALFGSILSSLSRLKVTRLSIDQGDMPKRGFEILHPNRMN